MALAYPPSKKLKKPQHFRVGGEKGKKDSSTCARPTTMVSALPGYSLPREGERGRQDRREIVGQKK